MNYMLVFSFPIDQISFLKRNNLLLIERQYLYTVDFYVPTNSLHIPIVKLLVTN